MKCSLGISHFLKEISAADAKISSLSHSIVFLCFFALIAEECFLISPCYSLELCIKIGISFLFSFAFCLPSFFPFGMVLIITLFKLDLEQTEEREIKALETEYLASVGMF